MVTAATRCLMSRVTVRWPCKHGRFFSHYLKGDHKWDKCEGGHNVVLIQLTNRLFETEEPD